MTIYFEDVLEALASKGSSTPEEKLRALGLPSKPKKVMLNGVTFEGPCRVALKSGDAYFVPDVGALSKCSKYVWRGTLYDKNRLDRGMVHMNKDDAVLHADALINSKFDTHQRT